MTEEIALWYKNPVYHNRSKHIEIKYHWIREHVDPEGNLQTARLLYVRTGDQSADMYTKSLTGLPFVEHRERNLGNKILILILAIDIDSNYRESETHEEYLNCEERAEWAQARKAER